jgi:hypothetical protein
MEAMRKALSRPAKAEAEDASKPYAILTDKDATAAPATDATMAYESVSIHPLETTDSGVYDAPTLADDGQLELEKPTAAPVASVAAVKPVTKTPQTPRRENRFTTVDEEARRVQRERAERWIIAMQLAGLAAALVVMAWVGWKLTRPATADQLYAEIVETVEESNGDPTPVADEIEEFLERFSAAGDERVAEVQLFQSELELRRLALQTRARARLAGGPTTSPAEQVYTDAMALVDADPARAAQMLSDLIALYAAASEDDPAQPYLKLARRELEKLQDELDNLAAAQLPLLVDRLTAAAGLETADEQQAISIYRALVNLYADEPWAKSVVERARERLNVLTDDSE